MKAIVGIFLVIVAIVLAIKTLSKESAEALYLVDGMSLYQEEARINSDFASECHELSKQAVEEYVDENPEAIGIQPLAVHQIQSLISNGWIRCMADAQLAMPINLSISLAESRAVPHKAALPYELAKKALSENKSNRCSDYIKPLYAACPAVMKPYMKRVGDYKKNDNN